MVNAIPYHIVFHPRVRINKDVIVPEGTWIPVRILAVTVEFQGPHTTSSLYDEILSAIDEMDEMDCDSFTFRDLHYDHRDMVWITRGL